MELLLLRAAYEFWLAQAKLWARMTQIALMFADPF